MALGSTMGGVLRLVLGQGARQIAYGMGGGLVAAFLITHPMRSVLGEELVNSPLIYGLVIAVIALVGLLALWVPARRATRVDPMTALRAE